MRRSLVSLLAASAANVALGAVRETPLEKVVTLLSDLQAKLVQEGEDEAKTYEKFACFCKDTMAEKGTAISDGQGAKTTLEADLAAAVVARDDKDTIIAEADKDMADLRKEIEDLTKARREGLLQYEKAEVDMTAAVQSLDAAIQALKAARTATANFAESALLEVLGPMAGSVQRAVAMADALGYVDSRSGAGAKVVAALAALQTEGAVHGGRGKRGRQVKAGKRELSLRADPADDMEVFEVPDKVYDFSSGDIVTTLEDLRTKFRSKKDELDKQEVQDRSEYDSLVQTKEGSITEKQDARDTAVREKGAEAEKIAGLSTDLSTTAAQLLDDQKVLAEVSKKCNTKATMWDKRTKSRANELSALASALVILKDLAADKGEPTVAAAAAAALAQKTVSVSKSSGSTPRGHAHRQRRVSLAARAVVVPAAAAPQADLSPEQRDRLVSLLRAGATQVHSTLLRVLAQEAREDPFAKVKTMIQELIERLLKEAASEANHKGWCDKEVALAEQSRDNAAKAVRELNGQLATVEARRDQLGLFLQDLDKDLGEINETLDNSTALRQQEKEKHEQSIKDAKEGKVAVEKAYNILKEYYASAPSGGAAALSQVSAAQAPAEPDAGFDGEYGGAQGAQTGIMGMLELIMADFDELVEDTEREEKAAEQEFLELETTLGASRAEKLVAQEQRGKALTEAESEHSSAWTKLESEQKKLDGALTQFLALKPACFDSGMSAEERRQQREEEMTALKQALCILDQHGAEGIEC